MRQRQPRRLPRAQRGRLVGRAQMPGLPRLTAARARSACSASTSRSGSRSCAETRDKHRCSASTSAARSPTWSRSATGGSSVAKVPSDPTDAGGPVLDGRAAAGRRGRDGLQPREHDGPERGDHAPAAEDRLPHHRGAPRHARPWARVWRPLDALTDAGWRRRFGDAARPLVPRYLRRGVTRAHARRRRACCIALDEDAGPRASSRCCARCGVEGVAICLLNAYVNPAHEQRLRELAPRGARRRRRARSPREVSPLAKEYARASTTVVDVFMKLIYARLHDRARQRAARARLHGRAQLRRLRRAAASPAERRDGAAVPASCSPARRPARCSARALRRAHRRRQPAVRRRRRHVVRHQRRHATASRSSTPPSSSSTTSSSTRCRPRSRARRRRRAASSSIRPRARCRSGPASAGADPGPACYGRGGTAADDDRRLPADGHPRPRAASPAARCALDAELAAAGVRGARHAAAARAAGRLRVAHRP